MGFPIGRPGNVKVIGDLERGTHGSFVGRLACITAISRSRSRGGAPDMTDVVLLSVGSTPRFTMPSCMRWRRGVVRVLLEKLAIERFLSLKNTPGQATPTACLELR